MPNFSYDGDLDIDIDDFLSACSSKEIKIIIEALVEDDYLPESILNINESSRICIAESEFEDALNKLHGKWHSLNKEDEETIIKMAKRF